MKNPTPDTTPSFTLITGATQGIGREFARLYAARGRALVLVARGQAALDELRRELAPTGARLETIALDLSTTDAALALFERTRQSGWHVETLVNNAGVGLHGEFLGLDAERDRAMLRLNMLTLTELCRLYAPAMVARGKGEILNVASTAAFQPGPLMSTYYASKAYVLSFTEALAEELAPRGVRVTALCPGATATNFQSTADMKAVTIFRKGLVSTAPEVAAAGVRALERGRRVKIPGALHAAMALSVRFLPRDCVTKVSRLAITPRD